MINADDFKEVGLDPDAPLRDWQYFKDAGTKLTKKDSTGKLTRVGVQPTIDMAYTWGWSNGGQWVSADGHKATMDDPRNVEAFQFATDMADAMGRTDIDQFEQLGMQRYQVDAKRARGHRPGRANFLGKQLGRHRSRSDHPEAAGIRDGSNQVSLRNPGHCPTHYRDLATKKLPSARPQAIELSTSALVLGAPLARCVSAAGVGIGGVAVIHPGASSP